MAARPRIPPGGGACFVIRLAAFAAAVVASYAAPQTSPAAAQNATPLLQPKPIFVPGLYETESRNSAFKNEGVKSRGCIASADFDAFQRETIAQYLKSPQFMKACKLSDTKRTADGFAFAMDCGGAKTIITFRFAKNLVSSVTDTKIVARPEYSSSILTLSRRVGDCKGQEPGKAL